MLLDSGLTILSEDFFLGGDTSANGSTRLRRSTARKKLHHLVNQARARLVEDQIASGSIL